MPSSPCDDQPGNSTPPTNSVEFVVKTYLQHAIRSLSKSTYDRVVKYLAEFMSHIARCQLRELKPFHLVAWVESHPTWNRMATLAHAANSVRGCFGWAVKMGIIDRDPFKGVRYISHDTRKPITSAEHAALLARTKDTNFTDLLVFLWESGMRPDELCRLEWPWVRYDLDAVVFEIHKTRNKTGMLREIPLTPKMREVLSRCRARRPNSKLVFMTNTNNRWRVSNNLAQKFRRARERASLRKDLTLYCYRHSEATRLLAAGTPDILAAKILGHADTRMLRRYAHPQLSMLREAMVRASGQPLL